MDRDEQAWQLLRSLGDVSDEYLLDAMRQQDRTASPADDGDRSARPSRRRGKLLTYRPAVRWVAIAAACLLVALVVRVLPDLGGGGATGGDVATAPDGDGGETIANPIQDFGSIDELEAATGFGFQTPEAQAPYDVVRYSLIDNEVAEVDYRDESGVGYVFRKAVSQASVSENTSGGSSASDGNDGGSGDDISGDYDAHPYQDTVETNLRSGDTVSVEVRGDSKDALRVAVWSCGGYDYAITADVDAPALTRADLLVAVAATN